MRNAAHNAALNIEFFATGYAPLAHHEAAPLVALAQHYEKGGDTGESQHQDFYALYIVHHGRALHVINGSAFPAARGDVYITPPGSVHAYRNYEQLRADSFCFQASFFTFGELEALQSLAGFRALFISRADDKREEDASYRLHLTPEQLAQAMQLVEELKAELGDNANVSPLLARGIFFRLLVFLARSSTRTLPDALRNCRNVLDLREVLQWCETHFHEKLSVPQLAALAGYSVVRFSVVFKRETGVAPATYLRRLRLAHAQKLLRSSKLSAAQIAVQSGFSDGAQLARVFAREFQTSPRQFRAHSRRVAPSNSV